MKMWELHTDFIIRNPAADDLQPTFDLLMRCEIPEYGLDSLRDEWLEMELDQQAWLAVTVAGSLVGYATATPYPSGYCYHVYVDPTWEGTAVNRVLLQRCDQWSHKQVQVRTIPAENIVTTWIANGNQRDQQAVMEAGFRFVKCTLLMCIELQHFPLVTHWPDGIKIRSMIPGQDDLAICNLMAAIFVGTHLEPTNFEGWRQGMMESTYFDPNLWFVALDEDEIIGACFCAVYPETQEAWIRQLGVAPNWQRRGVGTALIQHALGKFYNSGHKIVRIGVEADTPAHRLYARVGMEPIRRYDEYQKRIKNE